MKEIWVPLRPHASSSTIHVRRSHNPQLQRVWRSLIQLSSSSSKSLILLLSIETDHTGITWNINALFSLLRGHQKLFLEEHYIRLTYVCLWLKTFHSILLFVLFLTSNIVVYWLAYTGNQISWNSIKNLQKKNELWLK